MVKTKTMRNIGRDNDLDYILEASDISPITLETINTKLDSMRKRYMFWLWFFAVTNVIGIALSILGVGK